MTPPRHYPLIFGPPGSGRSTVAECLVERLNRRGQRAQLLTPVFDLRFVHSDRDRANVLRREDEWANTLEALLELASRGLEEPSEIS